MRGQVILYATLYAAVIQLPGISDLAVI